MFYTLDAPGSVAAVQGTTLTLDAASVMGTARITVTAHDGTPSQPRGRTDAVSFDFTANAHAIYGTVFADLNGNGARDAGEAGLNGILLFVDSDSDNMQAPTELATYTHLNGDYAFRGLVGGAGATYRLVEVPPTGWKPTVGTTPLASGSVGVRTVVFTAASAIATAINFGSVQVVDIGASRTVNEGTPVHLMATVSDPNPSNGSNFGYLWHVTADHGQSIANGTAPTFSFTPFDNGRYTVTLTLTDLDEGMSYQDSLSVTARNVAPVASAGPDRITTEGTAVNLTSLSTDAGSNDTLSYLWQVTTSNGQVVAPGSAASFSFTPADNGTYTVSLTVTDDGASSTDTAMVTVHNLPLQLTISGPAVVAQGQVYTLTLAASDPGTDTITGWQIAWGDGVAENIAGNPATVTHIYTTAGPHTIAAAATDEDSTFGANTLDVLVGQAPRLPAIAALSVNEGETLTFTIQASDANHDALQFSLAPGAPGDAAWRRG